MNKYDAKNLAMKLNEKMVGKLRISVTNKELTDMGIDFLPNWGMGAWGQRISESYGLDILREIKDESAKVLVSKNERHPDFKKLLATGTTTTGETKIVERIVEKIVEKIVEVPMIPSSKHKDGEFFYPDNANLVYEALMLDQKVILSGPTGSGKSTFLSEMAKANNWKFYRMNLNNGTTASQFVGKPWTEETEKGITITFRYGMLPIAMKYAIDHPDQTVLFLADEIDAALPENLFTIQRLLEDNTLVLAENFGEIIEAPNNFKIVATMNTKGAGDTTGLYQGTNTMNEAFMDRWMMFEFDYCEKAERVILKKSGINDIDVDKVLEFVKGVRRQIKTGDILTTFSTRKLKQWALFMVKWGIQKSYENVIIAKCGEDEIVKLNEIAQRVFGWSLNGMK